MPKIRACSFLTFPVGIGLKQVLLISASKSDSYHILSVPAAPEPIATANNEIADVEKETCVGAINRPTIQVNKTNDITLGFIKLKNEFRSKAKPSLEFLVFERDCLGLAVETIGTDAGQAFDFDPPLPAHSILHGNGRYGLQCLKNLDKLPTFGSIIIANPLKIEQGSGSPLRVLALVNG